MGTIYLKYKKNRRKNRYPDFSVLFIRRPDGPKCCIVFSDSSKKSGDIL